MDNQRRDFIKKTGLTGLGIASGAWLKTWSAPLIDEASDSIVSGSPFIINQANQSVIGSYGEWAAGLMKGKIPSLSFRKKEFTDIKQWKPKAKNRLKERLASPTINKIPDVSVTKKYEFDGLHFEELSWQLPYGPLSEAILIKPLNVKGKLPAILALHDHGGNKYFGAKKLVKTADEQNQVIVDHQKAIYEGRAWANEIAKRGYVVLVTDAFPFGSRRVRLEDVPESLSKGQKDNPETTENIINYNKWASAHEQIMAKSLLSAGTTWPGVFYAEDRSAIDILCAREDVDAKNIGCGGLSGGGMRTVFLAGQDERIKCAVCIGFMTTWKDFVLHKSPSHTWMTYVPLLPNELDFPEILGLRAPLPTLVQNDINDALFTLEEMKEADGILSEIFTKAKAKDNYKCAYYPGPHKFDKTMQEDAFDWFDKWLKSK